MVAYESGHGTQVLATVPNGVSSAPWSCCPDGYEERQGKPMSLSSLQYDGAKISRYCAPFLRTKRSQMISKGVLMCGKSFAFHETILMRHLRHTLVKLSMPFGRSCFVTSDLHATFMSALKCLILQSSHPSAKL